MEKRCLIIFALLGFKGAVLGVDLCHYKQDLVPGIVYTLNPSSYRQSGACSWNFRSATGTNIYLSCTINLPASPNCYDSVIKISPSGRKDFSDAVNYCGQESFSIISKINALTINVIARSNRPGVFPCQLTVVNASPNPIQNSTSTCECGYKNMKKIVGGVETGVNEFPFMAAIIRDGTVWCGGTLISNRFVLTAAHCLYQSNYINVDDLKILVGDHNISSGTDTPYSAIYNVQAYEVYPLYTTVPADTQHNYDVGIVRTSTSITFNSGVGPVCLPFKYTLNSFSGQYVTITGWGTKEFSGPVSSTLQKADLKVLPNYECEQNPVPSYNVMCTSSIDKDSCQKDSGGPLYWLDPASGRTYLVGIISQGYGCASGIPGLNVRVTQFLKWIIERTGSDTGYCTV